MKMKTRPTNFPKDIAFRYPWRTYQERILDELNEHLDDEHLHLVAPPGSGKTVLGLEVMLRLNQPTIIFAPTLTIKNQWKDRFTTLFLQMKESPDWISLDLKQPALLTITTYQSLFSLFRSLEAEGENVKIEAETDEEETLLASQAKEVLNKIEQIGFQTMIIDEAHHLRAAWSKAIIRFKETLNKPTTVALTATPPYDTTESEWNRYEQLCGPIDAEIHVAELVKAGDLCPHQDFVYLSAPTKETIQELDQFHTRVDLFFKQLPTSSLIIHAVEQHPWMRNPMGEMEAILQDPAFFSSMLIFANRVQIPMHHDALELLGVKTIKIPALTVEWAEILLNGLLKTETPYQEKIKQVTKQAGIYHRGKLQLQTLKQLDNHFIQSSTKLQSIKDIVLFEENLLKDKLRMVILADYIYAETIHRREEEQDKLGVIPIFTTVHAINDAIKIAVLTGSIIIIPAAIETDLRQLAKERKLSFETNLIEHYENYLTVHLSQGNRSQIVSLMTVLFEKGKLQMIIGTASLLGEGWDAPAINSLIIASYVGSSMLSNQMRGRAIRIDPHTPDKTSVIWHLATVHAKHDLAGSDLMNLTRRFRSLVGVHTQKPRIETGIERLGNVLELPIHHRSIAKRNKTSLQLAEARAHLKEKWQLSSKQKQGQSTEVIRTKHEASNMKPYVYQYTIRALYLAVMSILSFYLPKLWNLSNQIGGTSGKYILYGGSAILLLIILPKGIKAAYLALRYRSIEKYLEDVGIIIYDSLHECGLVETDPSEVTLEFEDEEGIYTCAISGGKTAEEKLYIQSMAQIIEPITNPRYLIYHEERGFLSIGKRFNYHAIPDEIGKQKDRANRFAEKWKGRFGAGKLIYTRSTEGRSILLKARLQAMSAMFLGKSERISVWK